MVFAVDRVGGERFRLKPALGEPYLIDVAHEMQNVAVFALYVKHGAQRRGDLEIGDRSVGMAPLGDLDGGDIGALVQRGDRRVVVVEPDLAGTLAQAVFDAPAPQAVPAVLDRNVVATMADIGGVDGGSFHDAGDRPGKIALLRAVGGTGENFFGIFQVRAAFPHLRRRMEPLPKRLDERGLGTVAAHPGDLGDGRVLVGQQEAGRLLEPYRFDRLVEVFSRLFFEYPLQVIDAQTLAARQLGGVQFRVDVQIDVRQHTVDNVGMKMFCFPLHIISFIPTGKAGWDGRDRFVPCNPLKLPASFGCRRDKQY